MVQKLVLDASAMLVLIQGELGWKRVAQAMEHGEEILISSVNLAEVGTKLVRGERTLAQVRIGLEPFFQYVVSFSQEHALYTAELSRQTKPLGLSLGDRACLALAAERRAKVLTADRAWTKLQIGVEVEALR